MHPIMVALTAALAAILAACSASQARAACHVPATPPRNATAIPPRSTPREDALVKRVAEQAATRAYPVITFGDSNMTGWPAARLSRVLGQPVFNAAVGGGTQTLIWELQTIDWSHQSPDLVAILVGGNNLGVYSACEIYWGIRTAVTGAHARFPKARIVVISILPHGENMRKDEEKIEEVNSELKASVGQGYLYLDAHDAFVCDHRTPCPLYKPNNWVHLSPEGFTLLGRLLRELAKQTT